jgi:hypothetical protein
LSQINSPIFGPGTITRDSDQGLEWLTPNATVGLSFIELLAALKTDSRFIGFRVATLAELERLYTDAEIPDINVAGYGALYGTTANFPGVQRLQSLAGVTYSVQVAGQSLSETAGFVGSSFVSPINGFLSIHIGNTTLRPNVSTTSGQVNFASAYTTWASATVGTQYQGVGTWLVSSVPEPATSLIFFAGLGIMVCTLKRSDSPRAERQR